MKVVFRQDVNGVGRRGEIRQVADAYARNYLLPKKLAAVATPAVLAQHERQQQTAAAAREKLSTQLRAARERLSGLTVHLQGSASPTGKLFAALKSSDIIEAIEQQYGLSLPDVSCRPDHVKQLGQHDLVLVWPDHQTSPLSLVVDHA